jgi:hypothetical protein
VAQTDSTDVPLYRNPQHCRIGTESKPTLPSAALVSALSNWLASRKDQGHRPSHDVSPVVEVTASAPDPVLAVDPPRRSPHASSSPPSSSKVGLVDIRTWDAYIATLPATDR